MDFRWIEWNSDKCLKHGIDPEEAEETVRNARRPYPRKLDDEKAIVLGQTNAGRYLQVVYLIEEGDVIFVIHAMPLSPRKKRGYRRTQK